MGCFYTLASPLRCKFMLCNIDWATGLRLLHCRRVSGDGQKALVRKNYFWWVRSSYGSVSLLWQWYSRWLHITSHVTRHQGYFLYNMLFKCCFESRLKLSLPWNLEQILFDGSVCYLKATYQRHILFSVKWYE
jgi:hypothetical protein